MFCDKFSTLRFLPGTLDGVYRAEGAFFQFIRSLIVVVLL